MRKSFTPMFYMLSPMTGSKGMPGIKKWNDHGCGLCFLAVPLLPEIGFCGN
jgi:hypothetical protein